MDRWEALQYVGRALDHAGISRYEPFQMALLPDLIEEYDKVEPLSEHQVQIVIDTIIEAITHHMARQN